MRILVLLLMMMVLFIGCELEPDWEPDLENIEEVVDTRDDYQTYSNYQLMLDELSIISTVVKEDIVDIMEQQNTKIGEYSFYQSGSYICHTFHWDSFSSSTYDWIYYVTVDVWTIGGVLELSMCSYYN